MATPMRRGIVRTLTLDPDVSELLHELAPSGKRIGAFLSELVRAEVIRRETRRKEREVIARELLSGQQSALVER